MMDADAVAVACFDRIDGDVLLILACFAAIAAPTPAAAVDASVEERHSKW